VTKNLSPEQLKRQDSITKAFELYLQGYSYDRIGYEMGCARSTAYSWVNQAQQEALKEQQHDLNILRNNAIALIDNLIRGCYEDFKQADDLVSGEGRLYRDGVRVRALVTQNVLKLLQERNKLLGLYAPERVEQFIIAESPTEKKVNYSQLELSELQVLFASVMRGID
jgi:hypothetical protein